MGTGQTLSNAAIFLYNAYKYHCHQRDFILFIMDKIGMLTDASIAWDVVFEMRRRNVTGTLRWILQNFKEDIPNCAEITAEVSKAVARDDRRLGAPPDRKRQRIVVLESESWDDLELLY